MCLFPTFATGKGRKRYQNVHGKDPHHDVFIERMDRIGGPSGTREFCELRDKKDKDPKAKAKFTQRKQQYAWVVRRPKAADDAHAMGEGAPEKGYPNVRNGPKGSTTYDFRGGRFFVRGQEWDGAGEGFMHGGGVDDAEQAE